MFQGGAGRFLFRGTIIHSLGLDKLEIIPDGVVLVRDGKIAELQKNGECEELIKIHGIEKENVYKMEKGEFLIPGFIDTHIHASQFPNIGLGYDEPLLSWLQIYTYPLEKKFSTEEYARLVYDAVVKRTLENGTTTACYFATIHAKASIILAESVRKYNQRAFVGKVNMNFNSPPDYVETTEETLRETRLFIKAVSDMKNPLITPVITPRFALSCDMELMKNLARIASEYNLPIQTHVSENKEEIKLVNELYSSDYVEVYDKAGLITEKTVLAHGIYLTEKEIKILKEKKSGISHCPSSNVLLRSGLCPVRKLLNAGIKVSLGSDCSGGASISMLETLRQSLFSSVQAQFNGCGPSLTYAQAFYLATLGGAQVLSIADVTGNFQVGKDFDAILVNMRHLDLLRDFTPEELFQKFIYTGDDRVMEKVFVAGKSVKTLDK